MPNKQGVLMVCSMTEKPTVPGQWLSYYMPWGCSDLKGHPIQLANAVEWITNNYDVEPDQLAKFRLSIESGRVFSFNALDASPLEPKL